MKWFMYIIKCEDGSFYVGSTSDVKRRFEEHRSGKGGRYTKLNRPKEIVYTEEFLIQIDALKRERQLKGWTREKKENLINKNK